MIFNSPPRIEIYHELYDLKRKLSNRVFSVGVVGVGHRHQDNIATPGHIKVSFA